MGMDAIKLAEMQEYIRIVYDCDVRGAAVGNQPDVAIDDLLKH